MREEQASFSRRYGAWALVAGASEGVGLAWARAMAERGLNVMLVSRRQDALDQVAAAITARWPEALLFTESRVETELP